MALFMELRLTQISKEAEETTIVIHLRLHHRISSQTYNLDANLCLSLSLSEHIGTQIVARILVKALMAMPAPDFNLCLFLIPERVCNDC
ncbi:eukaryotic translation initiation factor 3 subunit K-like isoform X2 [Rosa chinensis]|uniref:eukaryotic translation initiation factor 3 subunit K-like isoform X2 n=1 Tax=Rosa chinensis TaxID=74649 RepID=UPI001AD8CE78|nr:eukaryotic translation initiation factor 3 subunit K-like isoform X2 [Rosa chinensis]XP_040371897.1 eukaryotic translation initiation factor 3 subunit K-like isoform X2 [Rosa chinensis]